MAILSLSHDVLEHIFETATDFVWPSRRLGQRAEIIEKTDFALPSQLKTLLNLQLTCAKFHSIATPLIWETVHLSVKKQGVPECEDTGKSHLPLQYLDHVMANPYITKHIRILTLDIGHTFPSDQVGVKTSEEIQACVERLLRLTPSLRAFSISDGVWLNATALVALSKLPNLYQFHNGGGWSEDAHSYVRSGIKSVDFIQLQVLSLRWGTAPFKLEGLPQIKSLALGLQGLRDTCAKGLEMASHADYYFDIRDITNAFVSNRLTDVLLREAVRRIEGGEKIRFPSSSRRFRSVREKDFSRSRIGEILDEGYERKEMLSVLSEEEPPATTYTAAIETASSDDFRWGSLTSPSETLPWAQLEDLVVSGSYALFMILGEIERSKPASLTLKLKSLRINTTNETFSLPWDTTLLPFAAASLTKLAIAYFAPWHTHLSSIVDIFPNTVEFSLYMERSPSDWPELEQYLNALAKLKKLRILDWNHDASAEMFKGAIIIPKSKEDREDEMRLIGTRLPLDQVFYTNERDGVRDICVIQRSPLGEYLGFDLYRSPYRRNK